MDESFRGREIGAGRVDVGGFRGEVIVTGWTVVVVVVVVEVEGGGFWRPGVLEKWTMPVPLLLRRGRRR